MAGLQDGHSHLYERFLNRMVKEGLTGTVLPVRTTAPVGARMMGVLNYTVDAIYLDAAQVWTPGCCTQLRIHVQDLPCVVCWD